MDYLYCKYFHRSVLIILMNTIRKGQLFQPNKCKGSFGCIKIHYTHIGQKWVEN